jgi:hypothetical protein
MTSGATVQTPRGPFALARSCSGCTLCCRVLEATTLDKPMGVLCRHCVVGAGCGVHATRVDECRNYHCGWLIDGTLGEEWRPELAHLIITYDLEGRRLNVNADPDHADAWRREPYYSQLKCWAAAALERNGQVVAYVGHHVFAILPDRHVDLGILTADDYLYFEHLADGSWDARKVNEQEAEELRRTGRAPAAD